MNMLNDRYSVDDDTLLSEMYTEFLNDSHQLYNPPRTSAYVRNKGT